MTDNSIPIVPTPTTEDLYDARVGLRQVARALLRLAPTFPHPLERDCVRRALSDVGNAIVRLHAPAVVDRAQAHARRQCELRPAPTGDVPLSAESVEMYVSELVKFMDAHGEETA